MNPDPRPPYIPKVVHFTIEQLADLVLWDLELAERESRPWIDRQGDQ